MRTVGKSSTILFALISLACVLSCTRRIYVPVENVRHTIDTLMLFRLRTDTVIDRDSVRITEKGDTVFSETVRWRYRIKVHKDTLYSFHADSIRVKQPYPVEKIIEVNRLHTWQKILILTGVLTILYLLRKLIRTIKAKTG